MLSYQQNDSEVLVNSQRIAILESTWILSLASSIILAYIFGLPIILDRKILLKECTFHGQLAPKLVSFTF